jgi:signal transduction histidine kinase
VDLSQHLFWGVMVLGVLKLLARYPLGSVRGWRPWAFYLGLSLVMTFVGILFVWTAISFLGGPLTPVPGDTAWERFWSFHWRFFHAAFVNFLVAIGAWYAFDLYRRYQAREVEASRLEAELARAQHQALRMQLQPHFLFNALNTINSLIRVDPDSAERMVSRLGDLLRFTLEQSGPQEVSLRQELAILECYLEIQRLRFGDRLQTSIHCPEDLLHAMVPNLLLQPLVENAFKHGLGRRSKGSRLEVRISRVGETLRLEVEDNGKGLGGAPLKQGIGTSNTRSRLAMLYGDRHRFDLLSPSEGGALARIELPLHWKPLDDETGEWFEADELSAPHPSAAPLTTRPAH